MKKLITILVIIVAVGLLITLLSGDRGPDQVHTLDSSREVAENWVVNNSPTYTFDGSDLEIEEERELEECSGDRCFQFIFFFESSAAGYGDREDQMLAQVITPHSLEVVVEDGEVVRAVTDGVYSELHGMMLEDLEEEVEETEGEEEVEEEEVEEDL